LSGAQFSTLKSAVINDPEGPEKYNNTEVKYRANNTYYKYNLLNVGIKIYIFTVIAARL
jgi:hypothetical protein